MVFGAYFLYRVLTDVSLLLTFVVAVVSHHPPSQRLAFYRADDAPTIGVSTMKKNAGIFVLRAMVDQACHGLCY